MHNDAHKAINELVCHDSITRVRLRAAAAVAHRCRDFADC